jgi:hypothetical protein
MPQQPARQQCDAVQRHGDAEQDAAEGKKTEEAGGNADPAHERPDLFGDDGQG